MLKELQPYIEALFRFDNPIYFALFFTLAFLFLIYVFFMNFFIPYSKKSEEEKIELELKNLRLMGIFAQLAPEPLIRVNSTGEIIGFNKTALKLFNIKENTSIFSFLPDLKVDFKQHILSSGTSLINCSIKEKFYQVTIKSDKFLDISQLYFTDLTERKMFENKLVLSEKKFRDLSFYLQNYMESEKSRIGIELHDNIGQNLLLVKLKLNQALETGNFTGSYNQIKTSLDNTLADLREIMFNLKPRMLEDLGIPAAVSKLVDDVNSSSKIKGCLEIIGDIKRMDAKRELYLFRTLQESVNNIIKHSEANEFYIKFYYDIDKLTIYVFDDGVGFNVNEEKNGYGLFSINERVKNLHGEVKINSNKEEGTLLIFKIPLNVYD